MARIIPCLNGKYPWIVFCKHKTRAMICYNLETILNALTIL